MFEDELFNKIDRYSRNAEQFRASQEAKLEDTQSGSNKLPDSNISIYVWCVIAVCVALVTGIFVIMCMLEF